MVVPSVPTIAPMPVESQNHSCPFPVAGVVGITVATYVPPYVVISEFNSVVVGHVPLSA